MRVTSYWVPVVLVLLAIGLAYWIQHGGPTRKSLLVGAVLLLLATPAHAIPLTISAHDGRAPIRLWGGAWYTAVDSPPVESGATRMDSALVVLVYIGPFPQVTPVPFRITMTYDREPVSSTEWLLPPPQVAGFTFTTLGLLMEFVAPTTDYAAHSLVVDLVLPEDSRRLVLDVLQPAPEPTTLILFGTALALVGRRVRRWK